MIDKLVETILGMIRLFAFWVVLEPYERGLLVRLGTFKHELESGFHWRLPFHIDQVFYEIVVPRTANISSLSTTTLDGKSIGFDAVITYKISDLKKAILEVTDLTDAVTDSCAGIIGTTLTKSTWDEIKGGEAVEGLTAACRKRGFRWGVEIQSVQLKGIAIVKNIRLSVSMPHFNPGTDAKME